MNHPDVEHQIPKKSDSTETIVDEIELEPPPSPTPEKEMNFGDYLVFGRYSAFICMVHLFDVIQLSSTYTYSTFSNFLPEITSCGPLTFQNGTTMSEKCALMTHSSHPTCEPTYDLVFGSMPSEFGYYCATEIDVKTALSIQMIALIGGAAAFGQFSDLYGRKKALVIGSSGTALFNLLTSFTNTLFWFTTGQFIALFFAGGVVTVLSVFLMETLPKNHRLWVIMVFSDSPVFILYSAVAYFCNDWRTLARATAIMAVPHIIMQALAFESPRWLIQRGDLDEAKRVYVAMDKLNGSYTEERMEVLEKLFENEREKTKATTKKMKQYYLWHAFCTTTMIKHNVTMAINFCAMALVYYALMFNMETVSGSVYLNVATMGAISYAFNLTYGILDFAIPAIGRRPAYMTPIVVVIGLVSVVAGLKYYTISMPWLETTALLISTAIVSQQMCIVPLIGGELFPTPVRNAAQSFQQFFTRLGVVLAPQFFVFLKFWPPLPYLAMGGLMLASLITFGCFIPETKNTPLCDHMPPKTDHIWKYKRMSAKTADLAADKPDIV
uniref:MFS domain-containing protein n=1 Tax=Panagrellus redivivus TaxID=6233 RepID=A0A7E4UY19_PANRE